MPPSCCRCNVSGSCINCSCVKAGRSCNNCATSRRSRCDYRSVPSTCHLSGAGAGAGAGDMAIHTVGTLHARKLYIIFNEGHSRVSTSLCSLANTFAVGSVILHSPASGSVLMDETTHICENNNPRKKVNCVLPLCDAAPILTTTDHHPVCGLDVSHTDAEAPPVSIERDLPPSDTAPCLPPVSSALPVFTLFSSTAFR